MLQRGYMRRTNLDRTQIVCSGHQILGKHSNPFHESLPFRRVGGVGGRRWGENGTRKIGVCDEKRAKD